MGDQVITQPTYDNKMVTNKVQSPQATNNTLGYYKIGTKAKLHSKLEDNTCDIKSYNNDIWYIY